MVLNQGNFTPLPKGHLAMSGDTSVVTGGAGYWHLAGIPQSSGQPAPRGSIQPKVPAALRERVSDRGESPGYPSETVLGAQWREEGLLRSKTTVR